MLFPTVTFAVFFVIVLPVSWAADAAPARVAGVDPARELRLLRLVGLALRLPARRLDGRQPRARGRDPPRAGASGAQGAARARARFDLGLLGYFKYANFFLSSVDNAGRHVVDRERRAAGRHLLLHLHGDLVRRRHLPRRARAGVVRALRRLPGVLPASRRRPDRARERAPAAARDAARPAPRRRLARVRADRHRALPEGRDREPPRDAHRRRRVRARRTGTRRSRCSSRSTAYAVQIFADFCGYTNIAIGVALLLGFQFPQNFARRTPRCRCRTSGDAGT